ncbi:hypothetical protein [Nostoc sp. NMS4]|nr:hypothetical protein [Nostoc sp. NMS4]
MNKLVLALTELYWLLDIVSFPVCPEAGNEILKKIAVIDDRYH